MRSRAPIAALLLALCAALAAWSAPLGEAELAELGGALEASPDDEALRARYGEALFEAGRALDSLRVLNPGRKPTRRWVVELREAAAVYGARGQHDAAHLALREAIALDPDDASLYQELAKVYAAARRAGVALAGDPVAPADAQRVAQASAAESDAAPAAEPATEPEPEAVAEPIPAAPPPEPAARALEPARALDALTAALERVREVPLPEPLRRLVGRIEPDTTRTALRRVGLLAGGALALVALFAMARAARRGRGDLAVSIELPAGHTGAFSVRLSTERERAKLRTAIAEPEARASTRFEHFMVARETHFRGIPARAYWVTLEGRMQSEAGDEAPVREEREATVERDRSARVLVDLRPRMTPVEVRIVRAGLGVREGRIALEGDPTSLRLARLGRARLSLPHGRHRVLAGAEGAAAEASVRIESLDPVTLVIDLDDAAARVFADCEAAVEPWLRGDLSVAASALERAGQRERADLLLARFHQSLGASDDAAERFEAAGRWLEAAELRAERGEHERAAQLFEKAGQLARAAESHEAAGDPLRAGRAFEDAGDFESALRCYRGAGDAPRVLDVLEKKGDAFEAGRAALERGDTSRALRNLQQVNARSPHYAEACRLSAETLCKLGKPELALNKAEEAMTFGGPETAAPERQLWFADLVAQAGRPDRALRVLEELRERAPETSGLTTRIEELRKAVSRVRRQSGSGEPVQVFDDSSRYELHEQIGSGGMGVVYRAHDRRLGRDVALKRMPESLRDHPRAVELFLREARAAAALNHPNIVTVYDVDVESGVYFLTMELLRGSTVADVLRQRGRLLARDAIRLGLQVCAGLAYAHTHKIVHRDVKSSNLFLTDERVVKIMDFGLAKMLEEVRRTTTVVGGTPYYMAPEQAAGDSVDARADLYAFGVTLFELVAGCRPFEEGDVTWHHRHTPPPDPRAKGADVPEAFAALILALLAKDPADRPASADAVARQLQPLRH
jgi:tetratricopeptide (TPR) repeat protein